MKNKKFILILGIFTALVVLAGVFFVLSPTANADLDKDVQCTDCNEVNGDKVDCGAGCSAKNACEDRAVNPSFCAPCGG